MKSMWFESHKFVLNSNVGDFYMSGGHKVFITKKTAKRIYFSNGEIITLKYSDGGFYFLSGEKVDQILRDIEGYLVYLKHISVFI